MPASVVFGLGSSISIENLSEMSLLLGWSITHTMLSLGVSYVLFTACLPSMQPSIGATSFHNAVALPLLMVSSLCEQPALAHISHCKEQSLANCFVYLLPWQVCCPSQQTTADGALLGPSMARGCTVDCHLADRQRKPDLTHTVTTSSVQLALPPWCLHLDTINLP